MPLQLYSKDEPCIQTPYFLKNKVVDATIHKLNSSSNSRKQATSNQCQQSTPSRVSGLFFKPEPNWCVTAPTPSKTAKWTSQRICFLVFFVVISTNKTCLDCTAMFGDQEGPNTIQLPICTLFGENNCRYGKDAKSQTKMQV